MKQKKKVPSYLEILGLRSVRNLSNYYSSYPIFQMRKLRHGPPQHLVPLKPTPTSRSPSVGDKKCACGFLTAWGI